MRRGIGGAAPDEWRVFKSKRETPCCQQSVRVKVIEPGVQVRTCPLCHVDNWFILEEMSGVDKVLKMRWIGSGELRSIISEDSAMLSDLDLFHYQDSVDTP